MSARDGGPAFPCQDPQAIHALAIAAVSWIGEGPEREAAYIQARAAAVGGMSLRDYFAAKAMQAILNAAVSAGDSTPDDAATISTSAYRMADAMLAARERAP